MPTVNIHGAKTYLSKLVDQANAAGVRRLPLYHRDPFDCMLISQTIAEPARLLTVDRVLSQYSELVEVIV